MPTPENPLDPIPREHPLGGETSPEEQEKRDAEIMAGLRARRKAEAEAEVAAKPAESVAADAARRALDSFDWGGAEQGRRGDN